MRRRVFLHALNNVVNTLVSSNIMEMLRRGFERNSKNDEKQQFVDYKVFLDYALSASKFGEEEKQIAKIMGVDVFADPTWWQELDGYNVADLYQNYDRVVFAIRHLPQLTKLLKQDYIEEGDNDGSSPALSKELRGKSLLNVTLVENHGQFSSPSRLIFVLEAINEFYDAFATLEELPNTDLAVLALDSGSDKSFDFLGLAKVMDSVKDLILGIWDRRLFNRHLQIGACVDSIAQSLPVIAQIHEMKLSGTLAPEQAELLKRQIINGTTKFLEAGAVIPEMGDQLGLSPRSLMRPEQKMLAGPDTHTAGSSPESLYRDDFQSDEAASKHTSSSEDEIARLEELLRLAKGGK
jgi:hypothetical protein